MKTGSKRKDYVIITEKRKQQSLTNVLLSSGLTHSDPEESIHNPISKSVLTLGINRITQRSNQLVQVESLPSPENPQVTPHKEG